MSNNNNNNNMEQKKEDLCFCERCGHKWFKRKKNPVLCPKCKSPLWNKKRDENGY
ncbi:hypothetical protein LCGC14_0737720 [marine sediment metagenome]|uniref:Rubredoxin-like domain-containing protein n=1 Tax=marine sediment metagenome TaxID=412755 RepID=A0A0F9SSK8_9ZZZZ